FKNFSYLFVFFSINLFLQKNKKEILELPQSLKCLAEGLPELLLNAKADKTVQKYYYGFQKWTKWASANNVAVFPVKPLHLCLFCKFLTSNGTSQSVLTEIFYSVRWVHLSVGESSPTDHCLVKNVFEGAKRKVARPIIKKDVITVEILEKLFDKYYDPSDLLVQRIITISLLCYSGFLRSAEVLCLMRCDVKLSSTHMEIFIEKSKTDIYRDGAWVVIARTGTRLCPVSNVELYFKLANLYEDKAEFIFRNVTKHQDQYVLRKNNKPMLYNRLREQFIQFYQPIVPDISRFGLHSFRAGGATAAASNGVPDRLFKRHGRWRSETAKDGYVKDSLPERLTVSKNLSL
ncbi:uncharacterized protein, partial [Argopecten irradians]|uniref:uncharacterized protein n=1 Tax=Argopecten irradians TaxID=31199 RepID=UPI003717959B